MTKDGATSVLWLKLSAVKRHIVGLDDDNNETVYFSSFYLPCHQLQILLYLKVSLLRYEEICKGFAAKDI